MLCRDVERDLQQVISLAVAGDGWQAAEALQVFGPLLDVPDVDPEVVEQAYEVFSRIAGGDVARGNLMAISQRNLASRRTVVPGLRRGCRYRRGGRAPRGGRTVRRRGSRRTSTRAGPSDDGGSEPEPGRARPLSAPERLDAAHVARQRASALAVRLDGADAPLRLPEVLA